MAALTVQDAARASGWSPRMLRYIEQAGLVVPGRSSAGYRLYGAAELEQLRSLHVLLRDHQVRLDDLSFARRLRQDARLRRDVDAWLSGGRPAASAHASPFEWLVATPRSHERLGYVA